MIQYYLNSICYIYNYIIRVILCAWWDVQVSVCVHARNYLWFIFFIHMYTEGKWISVRQFMQTIKPLHFWIWCMWTCKFTKYCGIITPEYIRCTFEIWNIPRHLCGIYDILILVRENEIVYLNGYSE